jgi:hypothetical protein
MKWNKIKNSKWKYYILNFLIENFHWNQNLAKPFTMSHSM